MYQDEATISFHWGKQIISMSGIPRYSIARKKHLIYNGCMDRLDIQGVSFSTTSPTMLYVLTRHVEIYHFPMNYVKLYEHTYDVSLQAEEGPVCDLLRVNTNDGSVTSMAVEGLELDDVWNVTCHAEFVYFVTYDAVYQCVAKNCCTLSAVQSFPYDHILMPEVVGGNNHLYLYTSNILCIIDIDTMTSLPAISLQHDAWDIAVSGDDRLHVATHDGVHIYTADGTYTGQSYLDGRHCNSVTCVGDGYVAVACTPDRLIWLISCDLYVTATYKISMDLTSCIKYNPADGTLAIVNNHNCCELVLLPQEVYRPPFSLFSLCMSTIILNADELPISLLPSTFYERILNAKQFC